MSAFLPTSSEPTVFSWPHRLGAAQRGVLEHVLGLRVHAGNRVVAAQDALDQHRRPHHLEHVGGVVVGAVGDGAAGGAQLGNRRRHPAIGGHAGLVRDDGARLAEQRDVGVVDVAAVRREQPRAEEAVLGQERHRAHAVVLLHVGDFGPALRQVDGVAEAVLLGEGVHRLQQLGRRVLGQAGGGEDADAAVELAVPGGVQIGDALEAVVAHLGREARRLALGQDLGRHRRSALAVGRRFGEHPAEPGLGQRIGRRRDVADVLHHRGAAGLDRLERADHRHQRVLLTREQAARLHGQTVAVGEAEVLVEPAGDRRAQMGVAVDQAREERLAAAVVDLGLGILLENLVGRPDGRDDAALDRQRDVVLGAVDGDDRWCWRRRPRVRPTAAPGRRAATGAAPRRRRRPWRTGRGG